MSSCYQRTRTSITEGANTRGVEALIVAMALIGVAIFERVRRSDDERAPGDVTLSGVRKKPL